jgi:hypothetical protein
MVAEDVEVVIAWLDWVVHGQLVVWDGEGFEVMVCLEWVD